MYCMQCFLKSKYIKIKLSMIKIGELLRKLWSLTSCFLIILPPGALTPQGIEGAMKRDVGKHWCTLQWCASRGWFLAHDNWTSWIFAVCLHLASGIAMWLDYIYNGLCQGNHFINQFCKFVLYICGLDYSKFCKHFYLSMMHCYSKEIFIWNYLHIIHISIDRPKTWLLWIKKVLDWQISCS